MDTSSTVQMGGLKDPQVVTIEVRQRAAVLGDVALLEVELFKLG